MTKVYLTWQSIPGVTSVKVHPPPPAPVNLECKPCLAVTWHTWSNELWLTPNVTSNCWFKSISFCVQNNKHKQNKWTGRQKGKFLFPLAYFPYSTTSELFKRRNTQVQAFSKRRALLAQNEESMKALRTQRSNVGHAQGFFFLSRLRANFPRKVINANKRNNRCHAKYTRKKLRHSNTFV